ncbi:hypothetical protein ACLOJK_019240 [Asimina triloba]
MADAMLSIALEKLTHVLEKQISLFAGATHELEKLRDTFQSIQALLADAESRQAADESVNLWLSRLRGVAYDIDDLLDEERLDQIDGEKNKYCFRSSSGGGERKLVSRRPHTGSLIEKEMMGRDQDEAEIMNRLVCGSSSEDEQIHVIAIVGIGGQGKTLTCLPEGFRYCLKGWDSSRNSSHSEFLESLEQLDILDSKNLQSLPEGLGKLKKLKSLKISNAEALICLPNSLAQLESLEQLHISGLKKLESLPEGLERFKKLKSLKIRGVEVFCLPNSLGQLESLEELEMDCLKKFELPLEGLGQLKKLELLTIGGDE